MLEFIGRPSASLWSKSVSPTCQSGWGPSSLWSFRENHARHGRPAGDYALSRFFRDSLPLRRPGLPQANKSLLSTIASDA